MTEYKINLINKSTKAEKFWCFLSQPESDISSKVFANSSTFLTVPVFNGTQSNSFTVPLQYIVGVGASNNAVGLDIKIESAVAESTDLGVAWEASYTQQTGEKIPPKLANIGTAPTNQLTISTNQYKKADEPLNNWFGNMTYGVRSLEGFLGITWSPDPGSTYQIRPKVKFYVAIGSFQTNTLADINTISRQSAEINEDDFDGNFECTVTRTPDGGWSVVPGPPPSNVTISLASSSELLLKAHYELAEAHNQLVELVSEEVALATPLTPVLALNDQEETRISEGVKIDKQEFLGVEVDQVITGTITVREAVGIGFLFMVASGIRVSITGSSADGLRFSFRYVGSLGAQAIVNAFRAGMSILFTNDED